MLGRLLGRFVRRAPSNDDLALRGTSASETADACAGLHVSGIVPNYEAMLSNGYRRFLRPGDFAIDVGVHCGLHFDRLLACVGPRGHVVGFEPVPKLIDAVRARHGPSADLRAKALSAQAGRGQFLYMTKAAGESGFKEREGGGDRGAKPIDVEISTLDNEFSAETRVHFIKIDVEGHELSVLNGGTKLIAAARPIISVEYGRPAYNLYGLTASSLYRWTDANGYRISDLAGNVIVSEEEWTYVCDRSYWDFFLVPQERCASWRGIFDGE